jgi:hypothetical protein
MPTKDDPRITLRLDPDTHAALVAYAAGVELPVGEVARNVLQREFLPGVKEALDGADPIYACPFPGCDYRAKSPAAICAAHGRKVVQLT